MNHELWLERFREHLEIRGRAARTVQTYQDVVKPFLEFLESAGLGSLSDLTGDLLEEYRVHLYSRRHRGRPLARATHASNMSGLKAFVGFLNRAGYLAVDLATSLELPHVPRSVPRVILTETEVRQLLERQDLDSALGVRNRALLEMLYGTALRNAELIGLKLPEVDFEGRMVRVER